MYTLLHAPYQVRLVSIALVVSSGGSAIAGEPPESLRAAYATRNELLTGEISFSRQCFRGRSDQPDKPCYFTARFAGDDYYLEDRGDAQGSHGTSADGSAVLTNIRYLNHDGRQWEINEEGAGARLQLTQTDVIDVRALGFGHRLPQGAGYLDRLERSGQQMEYTERTTADGMIVVTCQFPGYSRRAEHTIDPARGWNIVRSVLYDKDKVLADERLTLRQYGNAWFPERWQLFEAGYNNAQTPAEEIIISHAALNEPGQPLHFTPADIGFDVGTPIRLYQDSNAAALGRCTDTVWDGEKPVPRAEFRRRLDSGELKLGPIVRRIIDQIHLEGNSFEMFLTEWEGYTKRFITRYELDEVQTQKAMLILDDCKEKGRKYEEQKREEFAKARAEAKIIIDGTNMSTEERDKRKKVAKARMDALQEPLYRIYELSLCPRLNKLPTRAQRDAAAAREAARLATPESQPAKP